MRRHCCRRGGTQVARADHDNSAGVLLRGTWTSGRVAVAFLSLVALAAVVFTAAVTPSQAQDGVSSTEMRGHHLVPADARLADLSTEQILAYFDAVTDVPDPVWGKTGSYVYFFSGRIDPHVAMYQSCRRTSADDTERGLASVRRALRLCEQLTGLRRTSAGAFFRDVDRSPDGYREWTVRVAKSYATWRCPRTRTAIANADGVTRATWSMSRLCRLIWSDPQLRSRYGDRARRVARRLLMHVVRNPHYSHEYDPSSQTTHALSMQIAPRNALALLNLSSVAGDARARRAGLVLAQRMRDTARRLAKAMPGRGLLLTSTPCLRVNTSRQALGGLETDNAAVGDGHGHHHCSPVDTSHMNAYTSLVADLRGRRLVFSGNDLRAVIVTMRDMWISADEPMKAYDREGRRFLVSEQFSDFPGRRLVVLPRHPRKPNGNSLPGVMGRNICPGWTTAVWAALRDPAVRENATLARLVTILRSLPMGNLSRSSTATFLAFGYGLQAE